MVVWNLSHPSCDEGEIEAPELIFPENTTKSDQGDIGSKSISRRSEKAQLGKHPHCPPPNYLS